jgi:xanthine dehydrogenase accessory factor
MLSDESDLAIMNDWLAALATQTGTAVLVTVAMVEGSGPREPGAKMLVTPDRRFDTLGGGHLEMRACEIAHDMLRMTDGSLASERRLQRFPLGPGLGQCCGGVVQLFFERIDAASAYAACLIKRRRNADDTWRLILVDAATPSTLVDASGAFLAGKPLASIAGLELGRACRLMSDHSGRRWLVDPCLAYRPHLMLFGAGHVGAAVVRALAELPCQVTWVDEREEMFPDRLPPNVKVEATDIPEALVDAAAPGSCFLVMTHSHALDQCLTERILRREFAWFGLIGSKTKRMQFEHRLRERGIAPSRLADMVCPIGLPGIRGKAPAVIAASVAAQLLQVWEENAQVEMANAMTNAAADAGLQCGYAV